MPSFTYTGEPHRYYPDYALTPAPDETYDLDPAPTDGRWVEAKPTKAPTTEEK